MAAAVRAMIRARRRVTSCWPSMRIWTSNGAWICGAASAPPWEAAVGTARAGEVAARAARIELSGNVARAYAQLGYAFIQQDLAKAELKRAARVRGGSPGSGSTPASTADPAQAGRRRSGQRRAAAGAGQPRHRLRAHRRWRCCWARVRTAACRSIARTTLTPAQLAMPSNLPAGAAGPSRRPGRRALARRGRAARTSRPPRPSSCPTSASARWPA